MLVTFTNASSEQIYVSALYKQLEAGESVQTRRSRGQLDADAGLKSLVAAGTVTLSFTLEAADQAELGASTPALTSYTNATRPAANLVPAFTCIWNSDDDFVNWSDGTNWRDSAGTLT